MGHQGSVGGRVWGGIRTRELRDDYGKRLWGGKNGICLGDALKNGPMGSWLRFVARGAAGNRFQRDFSTESICVTWEHKKYHVIAHVTKYDQSGERDIRFPSWGAQGDLSVSRTLGKRW